MANPERLYMADGNGSPDLEINSGAAATAVQEKPQSSSEILQDPGLGVRLHSNLTPEQISRMKEIKELFERETPPKVVVNPITGKEITVNTTYTNNEFIASFIEPGTKTETNPGEPITIIDPRTGMEVHPIGGGADREDTNNESSMREALIRHFISNGFSEADAKKEVTRLQAQMMLSGAIPLGNSEEDIQIRSRGARSRVNNELQNIEEVLRQRVNTTDEDQAEKAREALVRLSRQRERELQAVTSFQRVGNWIDQDEDLQRKNKLKEITEKHPDWTYEQAYAELQKVRLDSRTFVIIREEVESVIQVVEQDIESNFSSGALNELYQSASILIDRGYPELATEIIQRIESRASYRGAFLAMKYEDGAKMGAALTGFLPRHHNEVMNTPGVKKAVELLEAPDANGDPGAFYRTKKITPVDIKMKLLFEKSQWQEDRKEGESEEEYQKRKVGIPRIVQRNEGGYGLSDKQFGEHTGRMLRYVFEQLHEAVGAGQSTINIKTVMAQLLTEQGVEVNDGGNKIRLKLNPNQQKDFYDAVFFANRAVTIARGACVISGFAVDAAGPIDKNGNLMKPSSIPLDIPNDPQFEEYAGKVIDLSKLLKSLPATASDEEKKKWEREKQIVDKVRAYKGDLIPEALDMAWTNFYIDINNWNNIDFGKSFAGQDSDDIPRELWQLIHKPVYFGRESTRNPGSVVDMHRYAYMGVSTAIRSVMVDGTYNLFRNRWGSVYGQMRLVGNDKYPKGDKATDLCYKDGKKFLNSVNAVLDRKGEFISELGGHWEGYMNVKERQWKKAKLAEGALKFMTNKKMAEKYDFRKVGQPEAESVIQNYRTANIFNKNQKTKAEIDLYGYFPERNVKSFVKKTDKAGAFWEIVSGIFKKGTEGAGK